MPWTIFARHPLLLRHGEIDFVEAEFISRFNAVGSWRLTLDGRSRMAPFMVLAGVGIEVVNDAGITVFAGPVDKLERSVDKSTNELTIYGSDDNTHLAERVVHPEPTTAAPPYNTLAQDYRVGTCSTALRGYTSSNCSTAALSQRRVPGLVLAADPLIGSTVTGRGRWQNLLEFLRELALAGGGLGFRIKQVSNSLQFQVYMPVDRSGTVQFSIEKGNLSSYKYSIDKSEVNYAFVGGGGEGTARVIREGQDPTEIVRWRRIEKFIDQRHTSDTGELDQEASTALKDGKGDATVSIVPVDLPGSAYLTDYDLGDKVSAVVDDTVTEVIREVQMKLTPDGGQTITPVIGTPSYTNVTKLFRKIKRINTRVTNLERR